MKREYCRCWLDDENPNENSSVATLDLGFDENKYFCSLECLVTWIVGFSFHHFGERKTNTLIEESKIEEGGEKNE
jgi:hypothetical protein